MNDTPDATSTTSVVTSTPAPTTPPSAKALPVKATPVKTSRVTVAKSASKVVTKATAKKGSTSSSQKLVTANTAPSAAPTKPKALATLAKPRKSAAAAAHAAPAKLARKKSTEVQSTVLKAPVNSKSVDPAKTLKEKKVKVVRDSFTLPKTELLQINEMKKRAMTLGVEVKKSELIRAGLQALAGLADTAFKKAMANVPTIKTGRPAKD